MSDTPGYLEALIAYYQRDFAKAEQLAAAAVQASPWLYEGLKLQGDMQLQRRSKRGQRPRRRGQKSVFSGGAALPRRRADWTERRRSLTKDLPGVGSPGRNGRHPRSADEVAYAAAIENSDKITTAEPHSTAGP
ncbi:MAG: hypothetical protein U0787_16025 [Polyangia bacterium]